MCTTRSDRRDAWRRLLTFTAVASAFVSTASGQLTTWTGGTGTWNVAGNWTAGVPGAGATALIDSGVAASSAAHVTATTSVGTLNISAGDAVTATGGTLTINTALINAGTLSSAGGTVSILNNTVLHENTGGHIVAGGADVFLGTASVQGGVISTTGGGVFRHVGVTGGVGNDVVNNGNITASGTRFDPFGLITNNGSINLDTNVELSFGNVTLAGPGVVNMNGTQFRPSVAVGSLTNSNTIRGFGRLGNSRMHMINTGTLAATVPGQTLLVAPAGSDLPTSITFQNSGTILAAGGTLQLGQGGEFVTVENAGGRIIANGSDVNIRGRINGGTLSSSFGGVIRVNSNALYLDAVTNEGDLTVVTNGVLGLRGIINNNGSINLTGGGPFTALDMSAGSATLVGPGVVNLDSTPIRAIAAAGTLINNSTIQGGGGFSVIGGSSLNFVNNALVHGDNGTLDLAASPAFTNNAVLRVTNAGMRLRGDFGGTLVNNGSIDIASTGTFQATADSRLTGGIVRNDGAFELYGTSFGSNPAILTIDNIRGSGKLGVYGNSRLNLTSGTSKIGSFELQTIHTGRININNQALIIDYTGGSPVASVRQFVQTAYNNGQWDGPGITSALASPSSAAKTGILYAEANALGFPPSFGGLPIDGTAVLIRFGLLGDSNLDGRVDIDDFGRLAARFNTSGLWVDGDFNYNGTVDIDDFGILASNFNQVMAGGPASRGRVVPEPGTLWGLWLSCTALMGRRTKGR